MFLDRTFPFGTEVWSREGRLMKALARLRRRRFSSENTYSLFGVLMYFWYAKRHPGTKKFDKLLQPFQHHGQRRWHSPNRRVGAVCVCSLWRWGERNDLWCSRQREQNQRDLETEVVFQQWDSRSERWTPNPVSVFKNYTGSGPPILLITPVWNALRIDYFNVQFFDPLLFALVPLGYIFLLGENTWCTGGDLIWHLHGFIM